MSLRHFGTSAEVSWTDRQHVHVLVSLHHLTSHLHDPHCDHPTASRDIMYIRNHTWRFTFDSLRHFGTSAELSQHFMKGPKCPTDTSALVPNCLGSEVSWSKVSVHHYYSGARGMSTMGLVHQHEIFHQNNGTAINVSLSAGGQAIHKASWILKILLNPQGSSSGIRQNQQWPVR